MKQKYQIYTILVFVLIAIITTIVVMNRQAIINYFKADNKIEDIVVVKDNVKFANEYTKVGEANIFKYITLDQTINILKTGTGIVFFSFPECPWCQEIAPLLNEVAVPKGINTIYYYNIKEIREKNTEQYQEIVSLLGKYLSKDDSGNKRVFVPDIYFVKNGVIQGHNDGTSKIGNSDTEVDKYYTPEVKKDIKYIINTLIDKVYQTVCADGTTGNC